MYNDTQCITVYCGTKLETMVMLINHRMIGMPATKYENIKSTRAIQVSIEGFL